jgi:hypothetical protein
MANIYSDVLGFFMATFQYDIPLDAETLDEILNGCSILLHDVG